MAVDEKSERIPLTEVRMHLVRPTEPVAARLVRSEVCTARKAAGIVRHIELDVAGTPLAGAIVPGQAFGVVPPGNDSTGRRHKVRLYSVASPTLGESSGPPGTVIATTVKRTIDEHWDDHRLFLGVASNFLCDAQVGDRVDVSGPNGKRFVLPPAERWNEHDYVFFATGTGIAPFRGMVLDLLEGGAGRAATASRVVLIMGSPYATDLLYDGFFREVAARHANFTYLTAVSRERQADGHGPMYVQDRLRTDREMLVPLLERERTLVYICGVAGMELGIFEEMAVQMRGGALEQYLHVDAEAMAALRGAPGAGAEPGGRARWSRAMIHKQVRPTRRVFVEVYE
jgi:ferredoxin--NADP+ reductase